MQMPKLYRKNNDNNNDNKTMALTSTNPAIFNNTPHLHAHDTILSNQ